MKNNILLNISFENYCQQILDDFPIFRFVWDKGILFKFKEVLHGHVNQFDGLNQQSLILSLLNIIGVIIYVLKLY